jgi:hypothetical protein
MQVHLSIFKAYDIRGVVGQTIDATFAEHLGRAFGSEAVAAGEKAERQHPDAGDGGDVDVAAVVGDFADGEADAPSEHGARQRRHRQGRRAAHRRTHLRRCLRFRRLPL